jgi:hypothetical protein
VIRRYVTFRATLIVSVAVVAVAVLGFAGAARGATSADPPRLITPPDTTFPVSAVAPYTGSISNPSSIDLTFYINTSIDSDPMLYVSTSPERRSYWGDPVGTTDGSCDRYAFIPTGEPNTYTCHVSTIGLEPGTTYYWWLAFNHYDFTSPNWALANKITTAPSTFRTGEAAAPDFSFSLSPQAVSVAAGSSKTFTIDLTGTGGFNDLVYFTLSGLPSSIDSELGYGAVGSVPFTVYVRDDTPSGTYRFVLTGKSGTLTRTTTGNAHRLQIDATAYHRAD